MDGSVRPVAYISLATLDSQSHWTPLDLEADSIVWAIKHLRGYLWGKNFLILSHHKARESIGKVRPQCASPAVARGSHRVRLHPRVPQEPRQRNC